MNDLSKPETDNEKFINSLYERLCQVTMNKKEYSEWK